MPLRKKRAWTYDKARLSSVRVRMFLKREVWCGSFEGGVPGAFSTGLIPITLCYELSRSSTVWSRVLAESTYRTAWVRKIAGYRHDYHFTLLVIYDKPSSWSIILVRPLQTSRDQISSNDSTRPETVVLAS